jgi:SAM-dependent methyltransferase
MKPEPPDLHISAREGFQSGAATYERGRPDYPAEIDGWLRGVLGLGAGKRVLDLGAGTGKFTKYLAATGAEVVAVEPVGAMRERLVAAFPAMRILAGQAEAIPLDDASVDAVTCAQAFHWFATPAALGEIVRVLRPGGRLGLIWNVRDESVRWVAELTRIMTPYEKASGAPRFDSGAWRRAFPFPGLSALVERRFTHGHSGPPEQVVVDRVLSVSFMASLPADERERVAGRVREVIARYPELARRTEVTFPYITFAYSARKCRETE